MWNSGCTGKGNKNAGQGWGANGIWEEDVGEEDPAAQAMQLFGATEGRARDVESSISLSSRTYRTSISHHHQACDSRPRRITTTRMASR